MRGNSNKIVIGIFVALMAVVVILIATNIGSHGGGGGGPAPQASPATSTTVSNQSTSGEAQTNQAPANTPNTPEQVSQQSTTAQTQTNSQPSTNKQTTSATAPSKHAAVAGNRSPSEQTTKTVAQIYSDLAERGFDKIVLSAGVTMLGKVEPIFELSRTSQERYPVASGNYESTHGVIWAISAVDGKYYATPLGNQQYTMQKTVIFTEDDFVTTYNADGNTLTDLTFDKIVDATAVQVSRLDKNTLDSYDYDHLTSF